MKKFLSISLLIATMAIVYVSCSKDDDSSSGNSTNGKTTALFSSAVTYGTMTDQDGNVYKTVTIGTQIWMAENLRTTKYNDGTAIPNVTDGDEWSGLTTGAYCNYNNSTYKDSTTILGRLYNWYAVNTGKLAPKGWHVPTDVEWNILSGYLGSASVAGDKLKEAGTTHWDSPNSATNETGFTALPGGGRHSSGKFYDVGEYGSWWSATEGNMNTAWYCYMYYSHSFVYTNNYQNWVLGFSVRCIKD